ncbi:MAG TPA: hypothetical protein VME43_16055, partial [Bryobacteraceae bacterium]|nr:hypothetical protein [Bryobacteraceae bacterium]
RAVAGRLAVSTWRWESAGGLRVFGGAPAEAPAGAEIPFGLGMAVPAEVVGAEISGGSVAAGLPEAGGGLRPGIPVGGFTCDAGVQGRKSPGETSFADALVTGQALEEDWLPLACSSWSGEVADELGSTVRGCAAPVRNGPPEDGWDWLAETPRRERMVAPEERMSGEPPAGGVLSPAAWSLTGVRGFEEAPDGTRSR